VTQTVPCRRQIVDAIHTRDYDDHMIINLRDARDNLSQLVQLAADGEEIIITVRGRPMARLTRCQRRAFLRLTRCQRRALPHSTCVIPNQAPDLGREEWAAELRAAAESAHKGPRLATPQSFWDEQREERL